jgi:hypothetical protein
MPQPKELNVTILGDLITSSLLLVINTLLLRHYLFFATNLKILDNSSCYRNRNSFYHLSTSRYRRLTITMDAPNSKKAMDQGATAGIKTYDNHDAIYEATKSVNLFFSYTFIPLLFIKISSCYKPTTFPTSIAYCTYNSLVLMLNTSIPYSYLSF